ncbi:MAG TPA: hypothetical protein VHA13_01825 [Gammaproteobacteria bacterium]|nr:hypothetical protein [Gammaproteobacteria bacterium]
MLDYLYQLSSFNTFLILIGISIICSVIFVIINRYFLLYKLRYKDNATIGSISSLIGIIYGVLVGFLALYLIDNNDHASDAVRHEANATANIYRESKWLNEPAHKYVHVQLKKYVDNIINVEWPLMKKGKDIDHTGDIIIDDISSHLKNYKIVTQSDAVVMQDILTELKSLNDARRQRIEMSFSQLSPDIWQVILIGTILIVGINYAFRVNFYLHLFAISAFAIMAASMLFLLITLDRPFQGEFTVQPDAFKVVQFFIEKSGLS